MFNLNSSKPGLNKALIALVALLFLAVLSTSAFALQAIDYTGLHSDKGLEENSQVSVSGRSVRLNYGVNLSNFIPVFEGFEYLNLGLKIKVNDIHSPSNLKASSSIFIGNEISDISNAADTSSNDLRLDSGSYLAKLDSSIKILDSADPYNYSDQDLSIDFLTGMNLTSKPLTAYVCATWKPVEFITLRSGMLEEAAQNDAGMFEMTPSLVSKVSLNYEGLDLNCSYKAQKDNTVYSFSVSMSTDFIMGKAARNKAATYASL